MTSLTDLNNDVLRVISSYFNHIDWIQFIRSCKQFFFLLRSNEPKKLSPYKYVSYLSTTFGAEGIVDVLNYEDNLNILVQIGRFVDKLSPEKMIVLQNKLFEAIVNKDISKDYHTSAIFDIIMKIKPGDGCQIQLTKLLKTLKGINVGIYYVRHAVESCNISLLNLILEYWQPELNLYLPPYAIKYGHFGLIEEWTAIPDKMVLNYYQNEDREKLVGRYIAKYKNGSVLLEKYLTRIDIDWVELLRSAVKHRNKDIIPITMKNIRSYVGSHMKRHLLELVSPLSDNNITQLVKDAFRNRGEMGYIESDDE